MLVCISFVSDAQGNGSSLSKPPPTRPVHILLPYEGQGLYVGQERSLTIKRVQTGPPGEQQPPSRKGQAL